VDPAKSSAPRFRTRLPSAGLLLNHGSPHHRHPGKEGGGRHARRYARRHGRRRRHVLIDVIPAKAGEPMAYTRGPGPQGSGPSLFPPHQIFVIPRGPWRGDPKSSSRRIVSRDPSLSWARCAASALAQTQKIRSAESSVEPPNVRVGSS